jgi:cytochrome P450
MPNALPSPTLPANPQTVAPGDAEAGTGRTAKGSPRLLQDLPGPQPWPLTGHNLQVRLDRMHQDIERWSRQHGPMMLLKLGREPVLVLSDHALIGQLLRERPERFRRPTRMHEVMSGMGIADGVFVAEGERWAKQRRMVMASFAPQQVKAYFPRLLQVAERLRARWAPSVADGSALDMQDELMRFTVDVIAGLAFGVDVDTVSSQQDVIQQHLNVVMPTIWRRTHTLIPYWKWFRLPRDRAMNRSVDAVNQAIAGFMADARSRLQDPARRAAPQNLLEAMLVAADEPGSGMRDEDVVGNVFTMLIAGEDTTATSLSWMLYLLSRNPQAMQALQAEIDRVLPADMASWTPAHMDQLDHLEACIHESMRIKPVGPLNVIEPNADTVINGVLVPKGTAIVMLMRVDGLRDAHFPDASQFKPERWLPDAGPELGPEHPKRLLMPFGAGPRICPGRYLAMLEIKLVAAMLLRHFQLDGIDTPDGREAEEHMAMAMTPVGLKMRLSPRRI